MREYEFLVPAGYTIEAVQAGIRDLVSGQKANVLTETDMVLVRTVYHNGERLLRVSSGSEGFIRALRERLERNAPPFA